ncbi:MAG: type V CRISPR-associated protein Cas12b [Bacillota bacterium]
MAQQTRPRVTQRAYSLRLRGTTPGDTSWRDALWQTHEAVNKGAKAFGDWLLTLRGGLDHTLAAAKTDGERRQRRILLALSWLSVESKRGAPDDFIIRHGGHDRGKAVTGALEEILVRRGVDQSELAEWKRDCSPSLHAAIREDAVWVNRSRAFDGAVNSIGCSLTREEAWDMLERFFGSREAYLAPAKGSEDESSDTGQEEKAKDLVQKAGQWLSSRFGTGKGADFSRMAEVYQEIASWAGAHSPDKPGTHAIASLATALSEFTPASDNLQGVLGLISGPGYKSATRNLLTQIAAKTTVTQQDFTKLNATATADKGKCMTNTGSKGQRAYSDTILKDVESACGFTYLQDGGPARHPEFAVMLDHAARRVSLAHTWIKRAEAERRRFEEEAKRMANVPSPAREWLDSFCSERSGTSGALEPYRIRRRAVDGWKEVVTAWSRSSCSTGADRIAAARALQDAPEIDKFGDIQLFEALAEDDAVCVWHKDGDAAKPPDLQPLLDYVFGAEAEFKKRHFKVPAYRHPDALLHPIFCDFGKSRWDICFDVQKNVQTPFPRALCLTLWTGSGMVAVRLCWQSKRLACDLALGNNARNAGASAVTRADRLGRAASNVTKNDEVNIAGLFEQADWNGRLQAPRQQLEAIAARVAKHGWDDKAVQMQYRIQWLVSFSAKLQPQGPWLTYGMANNLKLDQKNGDIVIAPPNTKNEWRGLAYPFWHPDNQEGRKGLAKHCLSRLPGLRVLSVDLGHRYAAACAVWEAVNTEQIKVACQAAGHDEPKESDLYLHLKRKATKQKRGENVEVERTTIYRRIGADTLPDGTQHPASWARLDRQFLIRLQGEEKGARAALNEEIWAVHQLEAELGRTVPIIDRLVRWGQSGKQETRLDALRNLGWAPANEVQGSDEMDEGEVRKPSRSVDELMSSAVRTMRLALKRHGDRARIAFAMTAAYKPLPGDRRYYFTEARDASANEDANARNGTHIESIQDALLLWYGLASSRGWRDDAAKRLWDDHITGLSGYKAPEEIGEDVSGVARKTKQRENREKLHHVAEALVKDARLREALHDAWKKRWEADDERCKRQLRWFKDWILPRGKAASDPTIRKVGGLSLRRLATLTEFRRKVQVGFFTRLQPDGIRAEAKEQFGQSALDALEHLREQRVKQLASRIAEAALGIGRMRRPMGGKDPKRPSVRVDAPCHAIVIEDLTHYRPEETRTRRENRQLMTWSSSKVKTYLAEACQLHGLHLREVSASYTSRQDSRTGAPGIRCQDVPVNEFMRLPFWRKQVKQAEAKQAENKGDARERLLCDLNSMWKDKAVADWQKAGVIRVPLRGGEIFVSASRDSQGVKSLQADLNAAANIGLRGLTDPDWPGKWWYVPCEPASFKPTPDKVKGSAAINLDMPLKDASVGSGDVTRKKAGKAKSQSKEVVNLWRDVSSRVISAEGVAWEVYSAYQNQVQARVVDILHRSACSNNDREKQ